MAKKKKVKTKVPKIKKTKKNYLILQLDVSGLSFDAVQIIRNYLVDGARAWMWLGTETSVQEERVLDNPWVVDERCGNGDCDDCAIKED